MNADISLPLKSSGRLAIVDRDATIISSRQIAYACYRQAFDQIIAAAEPRSEPLKEEEYTRQYHPFDKNRVYKKYYPQLTEDQMAGIGEASWHYYLDHFEDARFNLLIPGMDDFMRKLKEAGNLIVILTSSHIDGKWLRHYRIPVDDFYSMQKLKKDPGIDSKDRAIDYILKTYGKDYSEGVTIGDNPKDHVDSVLSIGTGFGLGHPAARKLLRESVDLYAETVDDLYRFFGLD